MNTDTSPPDAPGGARAPRHPAADANAETERLRALLDRQPTCLLRLRMDGRILAANDAALAQLAARTLGEALDHEFTDRLRTNPEDLWRDFAGRVRANGAASCRCVLTDLAGADHDVQIQGVRQGGHPDGADSIIVSVRDISAMAGLERALEAQGEIRRELDRAREELERAAAERQRLLARLAEREVEVGQLSRMLEADRERHRARQAGDPAQVASLLVVASRSIAIARKLVEAGGRPDGPTAPGQEPGPPAGGGREAV